MVLKGIQSVILACCIAALPHVTKATCGGFIQIKNDRESGTINSNGYPSFYTKWQRCIWFLQAPADYIIKLVIGSVNGEYDPELGVCVDGLVVKNGSAEQPVMFEGCQGESGSLQSPSRWLWVYFFSDDSSVVNTGFQANWTIELATRRNINDTSPQIKCENLRNTCPNKECYSQAYKCDGDMDCGCEESGCDEADCGSFDLTRTERIVIGTCVGFGVFLIVFLGIGFLEIFVKKWSEDDYKRKIKEQRMRERKEKSNREVAEMAKIVEKHEQSSLKLDVPSIRTSNSTSNLNTPTTPSPAPFQ